MATAVALRPRRAAVVLVLFVIPALVVLALGRPPGAGADTITSPDTGGVGFDTALSLDILSNPVVAYYDSTNQDLRILHCGSPSCATSNTLTSPDTAGNVGQYADLELDATGNPVVSYHRASPLGLGVLHCGNANCTAGNSIATPDTGPKAID